jgi:hypothetical protein
MGRLVKQKEGDIGVAQAPAGGEAKDIFDLEPAKAAPLQMDTQKGVQEKEMTKVVLPEQSEAIEDVTPDKEWVESPEGEILPIEKSGKPEEPMSDEDMKRFAKQDSLEWSPDLPKKENLSDQLPADFEPVTLTKGKESEKQGHKTKSSL